MNRLNINQTKKLIECGVLSVGGSHILLDKYSKHSQDVFHILGYKLLQNTVIFTLMKVSDMVGTIDVPYTYITEIGYMNIPSIVDAYELAEDKQIIEIVGVSDVIMNVLGKENATINGIVLTDGMRIILHDDVNMKYNNKVLTVRGVGESIELVANRGRPKKSV